MANGGLVYFQEELRAARAYAQINEQQLGYRLHAVFNVPNLNFQIPALTLQPIVENAIVHGIKPKAGGGTVTVSLTQDESSYYVQIGGNGQGIDPTAAEDKRSVDLLTSANGSPNSLAAVSTSSANRAAAPPQFWSIRKICPLENNHEELPSLK